MNGTMESDHIKRMITLTGDNIKRLSLYIPTPFKADLNLVY